MQQRSSRASASDGGHPRSRPKVGALDAALRLLTRRAHSEREIWRKLTRRGYGDAEVRSTVAHLTRVGYLDDRSFAEGHVRRRSAGLGPLALASELATRGVERSIADSVLAGFDAEAQAVVAKGLAERLYAQRQWPGFRQMLDSVGPKLMRRGFSPGVARAACLAAWAGTAGGEDN